ncbi:hypothetical protein ABIE45_002659 [Methylobacterium sp. OAE515]|uniref:hypothetical protein n=1 Tax=Methylobacterium sp. OAE515 TaxID=2817895 RepID=UPI00178C0B18
MPQTEEDKKQAELGREHVIALIFGLLGVIQGLAFTHLADKMAKSSLISDLGSLKFRSEIFANFVYFIVCFLIVARVFQTYACGAVSYSRSRLETFELYAIFLAGLLQYYIFEAISEKGDVDAPVLFLRVMLLGILALALHANITRLEKKKNFNVKVQFWNMSLSGVIVVICAAARFLPMDFVQDDYFRLAAALIVCVCLFLMTRNSLNNTDFGAPPEVFDTRVE